MQDAVGDDTGNIRVLWWGNPWIAPQLRKAIAATAHTPSGVPRIVLSGKVTLFKGKRQMESPEWELQGSANASGLHTAGLVPFYPTAATAKNKRIPPRRMREIVREALDSTRNGGERLRIPDPLPDAVRKDVGLLTLAGAVEQAQRYIDLGVRHFCIGWDRALMQAHFRALGEGLRPLLDDL